MGNCLNSKVDATISPRNHSGMSKIGSKISSSSGPSSMTISTYSGGSSSIDSISTTPRSYGEILSSPNVKSFSFLELKNATRNFRPDSLLGEGGFGYVFKGWIDEFTHLASKPGSGIVIAVKKLKPEGFQGHKEWLTEVTYLGQLHHPNLVKLIGYCAEGDNRLLVYEFMPKGSLENHLFRRGPQPLPWATRLKVAIGAARGLAFLHDAKDQVIYRDFKASNILLDAEFNAKLSDFGLAKAGPTGDRTHVSTQVMGTHGYAAPEYIATGRLTAKSDVYSFGVVLLELLSGRRAVDKDKVGIEQDLVEWTKPYLGDKRRLFRIMDTKLEGQYPQKAVYTAATLASQCLSIEPKTRPRMSEVLASLEELQAAKSASREHRTVSSPVLKSPAGHRQRRLTPSASPLPTPRQSTQRFPFKGSAIFTLMVDSMSRRMYNKKKNQKVEWRLTKRRQWLVMVVCISMDTITAKRIQFDTNFCIITSQLWSVLDKSQHLTLKSEFNRNQKKLLHQKMGTVYNLS